MLREVDARPTAGIPMALLLIVGTLTGVGLLVLGARTDTGPFAIAGALLIAVSIFGFPGLFSVAPNEGKVLTLFGNYKGTVKTSGLWFSNPFMTKKSVSLRVRNFEAALRTLASAHPYDSHGDTDIALSTHQTEVNKGLLEALRERFAKAGVEVIEARISHLAYAQEIAAAMLQRQQASAIVAARQTIVEGAVGMVEHALASLSAKNIVTLDDERKAAMVSNLLVVLCSDRAAQPVVNTGTLYQ